MSVSKIVQKHERPFDTIQALVETFTRFSISRSVSQSSSHCRYDLAIGKKRHLLASKASALATGGCLFRGLAVVTQYYGLPLPPLKTFHSRRVSSALLEEEPLEHPAASRYSQERIRVNPEW